MGCTRCVIQQNWLQVDSELDQIQIFCCQSPAIVSPIWLSYTFNYLLPFLLTKKGNSYCMIFSWNFGKCLYLWHHHTIATMILEHCTFAILFLIGTVMPKLFLQKLSDIGHLIVNNCTFFVINTNSHCAIIYHHVSIDEHDLLWEHQREFSHM